MQDRKKTRYSVELVDGCRNKDLCQKLSQVDERLIYYVDRTVMSHSPEWGPLENVDDFMDNYESSFTSKSTLDGKPWYNSYPFGEPGDEVFTRFLGICRGKTKLKDVLDAAGLYCNKAVNTYHIEKSVDSRVHRDIDNSEGKKKAVESCTVMILTEKWDNKVFKKYEDMFLGFAAAFKINFIFLLANDYGYTEIPFLNLRNNSRIYFDCEYDAEIDPKDAMRPIKYTIYGSTWSGGGKESYTLFPHDLRWEYSRSYKGSTEEKRGIIPIAALRRFYKNYHSIKRLVMNKDTGPCVFDAPRCKLEIFGDEVEWFSVNLDEKTISGPLKKTVKALDQLIDALDKS